MKEVLTDARQRNHISDALIEKLVSKTARIGVIGLGYVGLPLAVEYAKKGFQTVGYDVSSERVLRISEKNNYIEDVDSAELADVVEQGLLTADDTYRGTADIDVFFICVPTPMSRHKDPDVTYIESAAQAIAKTLRAGQLVILKSTTYPNTTEGVVKPILDATGLTIGVDYFLAFSPERVDPGNVHFTTANTPVVVGGVTPRCLEVSAAVLREIVTHVHPVSSPKVGEMEKLLENIFRSVNIALVNELAQLCDRIGGLSMWEVVEAASSKPFGYMPFYPGPGLGGHCIPIDPYYLSWLARRYDFETSFITLAAKTNESMPFYVSNAVLRAIADQPVRISDAKILLMGAAFKKNVSDTRHSPAEAVLKLLREKGIKNIRLADPHVEAFTFLSKKDEEETIRSQPLTVDLVRSSDVVLLLTDHAAFDYNMVAEYAKVIVDTRNAFKSIQHDRHKIMLLGGGGF